MPTATAVALGFKTTLGAGAEAVVATGFSADSNKLVPITIPNKYNFFIFYPFFDFENQGMYIRCEKVI